MREHGTYAKYKLDNCRCYPCATEASIYNERRTRAIAYGTWQPFMDAGPIRQHVRHLSECGIGTRQLAALAGVNRSLLSKLLYGKPGKEPTGRVRTANALRILAVEPTLTNIAPSTPIDSTGSHRRLQALVVAGWSQAKLSNRLGMTRPNFGALMGSKQVTAAKAAKIRALYDDLWNQAPPEHGHRDKIAASRARNLARAHGWVSCLAWDDSTIDDPQATPDLGQKVPREVALLEDTAELMAQGYTKAQSAERLGVSVDYINQARSRVRRADKEVAA